MKILITCCALRSARRRGIQTLTRNACFASPPELFLIKRVTAPRLSLLRRVQRFVGLLQNVFMRIFVVITRKVPACFEREGVSPSTAAGRQRILDDIGFVCTDLSMLRGVDASTLGLEQAIADRYSKPRGLMSGRGSPAG